MRRPHGPDLQRKKGERSRYREALRCSDVHSSVTVRSVLVPLRRPVVSKVGLFDQWPVILIDLLTEEGITGRSYLEPYLKHAARYIVPAIHDLADLNARAAPSGRSRIIRTDEER